ncbi:hypothetical protein FF2_023154 [Malus domestica]
MLTRLREWAFDAGLIEPEPGGVVDSDAIGVALNDPSKTVTNESHEVGFDLNVVASVEEEKSVGGTEIDHVHPVLEGAEQGAHAVLEERNMTQDSDPLDLFPFD